MKKIVRLFGKILAIVFPLKMLEILNAFEMHIRAGYWSQYMEIGDNVIIYKGVKIITPSLIKIGEKTAIGAYGTLYATPSDKNEKKIEIGNNCSIGSEVHITASNHIIIGDNVLLGKKVTISDNSHGVIDANCFDIVPKKREVYSKGKVIINDNVWIGDKATILPGVVIGVGAIIGANSVVSKSVPCRCVVVGNPARIIHQF